MEIVRLNRCSTTTSVAQLVKSVAAAIQDCSVTECLHVNVGDNPCEAVQAIALVWTWAGKFQRVRGQKQLPAHHLRAGQVQACPGLLRPWQGSCLQGPRPEPSPTRGAFPLVPADCPWSCCGCPRDPWGPGKPDGPA